MTTTQSTAIDLAMYVRRVLPALRALAADEPAFAEFFDRCANELAAAVPAVVGIWVVDERNGVHLTADTGFQRASCFERLDFARWNQQALLGALRRGAVESVAPPAGFPLAGDAAVFVPVIVDQRPVAVIELLCADSLPDLNDGEVRAAFDELLTVIRSYVQDVATSARDSSAAAAVDEFRDFALRLHRSLETRLVALHAVNDLRVHVGCDRVSFLERTGGRYRLRAVSGQSRVNYRSNQVRLLTELVTRTMPAGMRFIHDAHSAAPPSPIARTLADYLSETSSRAVLLEPVFDPDDEDELEQDPDTAGPRRSDVCGVLVFELFRESRWKPAVRRRIANSIGHVGLAWSNARRHERLQIPGLRELVLTARGLQGSRLALLTAICVLLVATIAVLATVPGTLTVDADGRVFPIVCRSVFAPMDGEIAELHVAGGTRVAAGDPLFTINNRQLAADLLAESSRLQQQLASRAALQPELHDSAIASSREQLLQLQARIEGLTIEIDSSRQRLRVLEQEDERRIIRAPTAGTVVTSRADHEFTGRPVRAGDALVEIMDEKGPWRLELHVPERQIGHALAEWEGQQRLPVRFRMGANMDATIETQVSRIDRQTRASLQDGSVVLVYAELDRDDLPVRRIGAEATAQLKCGRRSLLFVYFGDVQAFLARHWWF